MEVAEHITTGSMPLDKVSVDVGDSEIMPKERGPRPNSKGDVAYCA